MVERRIEEAIELLATKIVDPSIQPDHAMKYTQAALNLAHVSSVLCGVALERDKTKGASAS